MYIRYFWQGNHQIYGRTQCTYTIVANPIQNTDKSRSSQLLQKIGALHSSRQMVIRLCSSLRLARTVRAHRTLPYVRKCPARNTVYTSICLTGVILYAFANPNDGYRHTTRSSFLQCRGYDYVQATTPQTTYTHTWI